ncbi:MAG: hypothetical protein KatS3mg105_1055 [Gemmatales bacterium]|nr:MAG: hypothetical protein KatS3mg105_1055 [Gemmatales bacterium]
MQRATDNRDYTVRELARKWRVSPAAVRKLIRDGQLPAYEPIPGSRSGLRITREAVAAWERRHTVRPAVRHRRRGDGIDPEVRKLLGE